MGRCNQFIPRRLAVQILIADIVSDRIWYAPTMRIEWTTAAAKHGVSKKSVRYVMAHCGLYYLQPAPLHSAAGLDAPRRVYLGDDSGGTALEIMAVELESDSLLVIHAMPLREKYRRQYEEAKKWRI
jgi:hypothetical protein